MAHGIGDQVAQRAAQVLRLGIGPTAAVFGDHALAAVDADIRAQGRQFADHLIDQRPQLHLLETQVRRTALQP